ncbi:MAG: LLM class flavin-dependent oxidoreductase, partial [Chloroflexi bacterium]|nr:LLM class flavin-dependent oxidoreductase [Chloroflexota bacterium]
MAGAEVALRKHGSPIIVTRHRPRGRWTSTAATSSICDARRQGAPLRVRLMVMGIPLRPATPAAGVTRQVAYDICMPRDRLTFGVLPGHDESGDLLGTVELAEALGFDSVWVGDHVLWYVPSPDPIALLGAIAARTSRVRLGTAVMLAALRPAVVGAKAAATLDHLSGGRFVFGVGIGGENPAEFKAAGVPLRERSSRLDETLRICRALWSASGPVTFEGRHMSLHEARFDLPPLTPSGPPIWVGGRAPGSLRRAGELGDGWLAFVVTPQRFREGWATVRAHAEAAGRDPDALTPGLQVWCALADSDGEARGLIAPAIEAMYRTPFERFERYTIYGTP